jgi:hypothetical protein
VVPRRRHSAARALTCSDVRSDVREPEGEAAEQQDPLQPQQMIKVVVASPPVPAHAGSSSPKSWWCRRVRDVRPDRRAPSAIDQLTPASLRLARPTEVRANSHVGR